MQPIYRLSYEQSLCCGKERQAEMVYRLDGSEPFANLTLAQLGVPPLEILRVDIGEGEYAYFELSADANFMQFS